MSLDLKKRVLAAFVVFFTLWPLVQIGMTLRFETSPWRFGAWGMYSIPDGTPGVRLEVLADGAWQERSWRREGSDIIKRVGRFQRRRDFLGLLAAPDWIGETLLRRHLDWDAVSIVLDEIFLDRKTALIEIKERAIVYDRN